MAVRVAPMEQHDQSQFTSIPPAAPISSGGKIDARGGTSVSSCHSDGDCDPEWLQKIKPKKSSGHEHRDVFLSTHWLKKKKGLELPTRAAFALRKFILVRPQKEGMKQCIEYPNIFDLRGAFISEFYNHNSDSFMEGGGGGEEVLGTRGGGEGGGGAARAGAGVGGGGRGGAAAAEAETSCVLKISAQRLYLQAQTQYSPEKDLTNCPDWVIFKDLEDNFAFKFKEVLEAGARRDKLKNFALNLLQDPERLSSLSNFNYLCVHCIYEFLLRYPNAAADAETSNLQAAKASLGASTADAETSNLQAAKASLGVSVKNSSSVDEPIIRKTLKKTPSCGDLEKLDTQDMQAVDAVQEIKDVKAKAKYLDSLDLAVNTSAADPDAEKWNLELLKALGDYLKDLNLCVSDLENYMYAYMKFLLNKPGQCKHFAKLQSLLVNKGLLFANSHQSEQQDRAFHVLERTILSSKYFSVQNELIMELVEQFNLDISKKSLDEKTFKDLCAAVASEQLHFVFDILEISNPGWNGDESPAKSLYFVPEAEDPPPQSKRRQNTMSPSTQPLVQNQRAVAAGEATKQDEIRSLVRDDNYIWLDLQGDVLMEALSYERRDLKGRSKASVNRLSIFERLCKQACAVFVFP
jgi:hypothetical protein